MRRAQRVWEQRQREAALLKRHARSVTLTAVDWKVLLWGHSLFERARLLGYHPNDPAVGNRVTRRVTFKEACRRAHIRLTVYKKDQGGKK